MTREELIEKARAFLALPRGAGYLCDFELIDNFCLPLLAQERRKAIEECAELAMSRLPARDNAHSRASELAHFADQLRALARGEGDADQGSASLRGPAQRASQGQTEKPGAASSTGDASGSSRTPEKPTPPALSDAEILDRAAEILERKDVPGMWALTIDNVRRAANSLRQPRPAQEADWAESHWGAQFIAEASEALCLNTEGEKRLAALLRDRFGPLLDLAIPDIREALNEARACKLDDPRTLEWVKAKAKVAENALDAALSRLRAAGGGG